MSTPDLAAILAATPDGITIRLKVVPNASRAKIAGILGDRLKVAVAAPPEDGKANRAVCELLAATFNVPLRSVAITAGQTQPQKTAEVLGVTLCDATERLSRHTTR